LRCGCVSRQHETACIYIYYIYIYISLSLSKMSIVNMVEDRRVMDPWFSTLCTLHGRPCRRGKFQRCSCRFSRVTLASYNFLLVLC
jgi:hypothetical protein